MTGLHIWNVSILHSSKVSCDRSTRATESREHAFCECLFMACAVQALTWLSKHGPYHKSYPIMVIAAFAAPRGLAEP